MKRYQIYPAGPGNDDMFAIDPCENEDGEWVRYEDVKHMVELSDDELEMICEDLRLGDAQIAREILFQKIYAEREKRKNVE